MICTNNTVCSYGVMNPCQETCKNDHTTQMFYNFYFYHTKSYVYIYITNFKHFHIRNIIDLIDYEIQVRMFMILIRMLYGMNIYS